MQVISKDVDHERWAKQRAIYDSMFEMLRAHVPIQPHWTVAEFGVGKWGFGRFYAERFPKVYGIDTADYSKHHPTVQFLLSRNNKIPLPNASIDLVVSHSVIEHVEDLDRSLTELNRITKRNGYFFLTVRPLYFSSYGAHLNRNGRRLENWEHLDPDSEYFLCRNPIDNRSKSGHALNMLTSSKFLQAVGGQPWEILHYELSFEKKPIPDFARNQAKLYDLICRGFRFVGRKAL